MNGFYDFYLKRREELIRKSGLSAYVATRIAYNEAMNYYAKTLSNLYTQTQTFILKEI